MKSWKGAILNNIIGFKRHWGSAKGKSYFEPMHAKVYSVECTKQLKD